MQLLNIIIRPGDDPAAQAFLSPEQRQGVEDLQTIISGGGQEPQLVNLPQAVHIIHHHINFGEQGMGAPVDGHL